MRWPRRRCMMLKAYCRATPITPHICLGLKQWSPKPRTLPGGQAQVSPGGLTLGPGHQLAGTLRKPWARSPGADSRMLTCAMILHDGARPSPTPCTAGHPLTVGLLSMASPSVGLPLTVGPLLFMGLLSTASSLPYTWALIFTILSMSLIVACYH